MCDCNNTNCTCTIQQIRVSNNSLGRDGESAYQTAVRLGFIGTETEWLDSIKAHYTTIIGDPYDSDALANALNLKLNISDINIIDGNG